MATQAKRLLPGLVAVAVLAGCATGTTVSGSGGPEPAAVTGAVTPAPAAPQSGEASESRQVSGFTGVELTAIGDLHIEQTGTESLTIDADADVLPQLTSTVSHGVLELGVAPGTTITTSRPIVYRLTVATLNSVAVSGRGDVTLSNLRTDRLAVDIDGMRVAGADDVSRAVARLAAGQQVTFTVLRGGTDRRAVKVTLAERPA